MIDFKGLINKKKDATQISVPLEKELHGVKIRKLPNGAYIKALNTVQNLPQLIMEGCFPGKELEDVLSYFQSIDSNGLMALAGKLIAAVPEQFFKLISELLTIPLEKLMDELTPNETLEILVAFWEANDMSPFFENLKKKIFGMKMIQNLMSEPQGISNLTASIGSRTGSTSPKKSASGKKNS